MARNTNQPSFNFFTGETGGSPPAPAPSFRETLRQSVVKPGAFLLASTLCEPSLTTADHGNEDLRAQINTLHYELESLKQEREMTTLSHQAELRDAQNKADAEYRRAQVGEAAFSCSCAQY